MNLFGIIKRNIYSRKDLKSATQLSDDVTVETAQKRHVRIEQERTLAMALLLRRTA